MSENEQLLAKVSYFDSAQRNGIVLKVQTSPHRVHHRFRLLEDLLLHEVVVIALHDLLNLHFQGRDLASVRIVHAATKTMDAQRALLNGRDVVILKREHASNGCFFRLRTTCFENVET